MIEISNGVTVKFDKDQFDQKPFSINRFLKVEKRVASLIDKKYEYLERIIKDKVNFMILSHFSYSITNMRTNEKFYVEKYLPVYEKDRSFGQIYEIPKTNN